MHRRAPNWTVRVECTGYAQTFVHLYDGKHIPEGSHQFDLVSFVFGCDFLPLLLTVCVCMSDGLFMFYNKKHVYV